MRISAALLVFLGLADARKRTQRTKKDGEHHESQNLVQNSQLNQLDGDVVHPEEEEEEDDLKRFSKD